MLNENRFLGTFRGHNTRTIFIDTVDGLIDRVNNPGGCLVGSVFLYSSKFLIFCYFCTCKSTVGHGIYISICCISNFGHLWLTTDLIIDNYNMNKTLC